jgi:hypothetical protein
MTDCTGIENTSGYEDQELMYDSMAALPGEGQMSELRTEVLVLFVDDIRAGRMSSETLCRAKKVAELWKTGRYDYILVVGGIFRNWNVQWTSAAETIATWLMKTGIEDHKIMKDNRSKDVFEAVERSFGILRANRLKTHGDDAARLTVCSGWQQCLYVWALYRYGYKTSVKMILVAEPEKTWKSWFNGFYRMAYTFWTAIPEAQKSLEVQRQIAASKN